VRLYLDSNALIYAVEGADAVKRVVAEWVVRACLPGGIVITSLLSRLECRVLPLRQKNQLLLAKYEALFGRHGLKVLEVSSDVLERAATLRADHKFKTADAIHLATALEAGTDIFLTGDTALARCPGLHVELLRPI
jgi:predicted nucleic acid-binding protein